VVIGAWGKANNCEITHSSYRTSQPPAIGLISYVTIPTTECIASVDLQQSHRFDASQSRTQALVNIEKYFAPLDMHHT
jgi:hypothetical protein